MPYSKIALGQLGQVSQGITLHRYRSKEGTEGKGGVEEKVVSIKDIDRLQIKEVSEKCTFNKLNMPTIERYRLRSNDIVIAVRGAISKAAVITLGSEGSVAGQNVAFFRPNDSCLDSLYLAVLMRSQEIAFSFSRLSSSSSPVRSLRISQLRTLEIPLPDLAIQQEIAQLSLLTEEATQVATEMIQVRQRLAELTILQILQSE